MRERYSNPSIVQVPHTTPVDKLNTMRTEAHTTYNVNYHIVTIPKYRRQILRHPKFKEILKDIIVGQAEEKECQVLAFEVQPDHIHLFLSVPPKYSASQIVKQLKGNSSRQLRRIFPDLIKQYNLGEHLWAKGFFVSTAGYISEDTVRKYINEQEHHRQRDEWNQAHPKGKQKRIG